MTDERPAIEPAIEPPTAPAPRPPQPAAPGIAPQGRTAARLSQRQKAAVIVQMMLDGGMAVPLAGLQPDDQAELTRVLAAMRYVDRDTLQAVAREFLAELESIGLSFPDGIDRALNLIEGYISVQAANDLRRQHSPGHVERGSPWTRIAALDIADLLPLLEGESPTVAAIVAAKLSTAKAAEMLQRTEGRRAREIALAIPVVAGTHPSTVERIGATLAARLESRPPTAFHGDPAERIGAILNRAPSETRETLLQDLHTDDPEFASRVRRSMFTFGDIPARVPARDVARITRNLDEATLVTALTAAADSAPEAAEFILANVSRRMAEQLNEAMGEHPPLKRREADAAMDQVMQAIRDLEASGEIALVPADEGDEA
jgi:flagellar motor switch protein FliG